MKINKFKIEVNPLNKLFTKSIHHSFADSKVNCSNAEFETENSRNWNVN